MKNALRILMVFIGLTFIYNAQTNTGFVYLNSDTANWIILVDSNSNILRYYKASPSGEERLDTGFENWLRDKISKGLPFKSQIIPFRQQLDQQKRLPR